MSNPTKSTGFSVTYFPSVVSLKNTVTIKKWDHEAIYYIISSSAGIAVDFEESKAIDDVAVIEERNVVNDVVAVNETPAEDITLKLDSEELHYLCQETN